MKYSIMLKVFSGKFIEDVTKRVNIRYFNSFDRMESCLRNHVQSMPTIINSDLVQVILEQMNIMIQYLLCLVSIIVISFRFLWSKERSSLTSRFKLVSLCWRKGELIDQPYGHSIKYSHFSKLIMADFWYGIVLPLFGEEHVKLCYTGDSIQIKDNT